MLKTFVENSTSTGIFTPFAPQEEITRTRTSREFKADAEILHRRAVDLTTDTAELRRSALVQDLADSTEEAARKAPEELLDEISDSGMSWRDVARILGITVPAIQKWRRGGTITGSNRLKLGEVAALLGVLERNMINQGVSWLEMPVKQGVGLTRLDLWAAGRKDLLLELISDDASRTSPDGVLDTFNPNWRTELVDNAFESFVAGDGAVSVRPIQ